MIFNFSILFSAWWPAFQTECFPSLLGKPQDIVLTEVIISRFHFEMRCSRRTYITNHKRLLQRMFKVCTVTRSTSSTVTSQHSDCFIYIPSLCNSYRQTILRKYKIHMVVNIPSVACGVWHCVLCCCQLMRTASTLAMLTVGKVKPLDVWDQWLMCCGMGLKFVVSCACELIHCFLLCSVLLELCINLSSDVLYTDNFIIDDQWWLIDMMDTHIVDRMCFFMCVACTKGPYPCCQGQSCCHQLRTVAW